MDFKNLAKRVLSNPKEFFLENLTLKQTILKNTIWLSVSEFFVRLFKYLLIIFAARILTVNQYGQFSFALSFIGFFVAFGDLGISQIATRELSKNEEFFQKFSSIFTLKFLLQILTLILIFLTALLTIKDNTTRITIFLLGFYFLFSSLLDNVFIYLRATQKMEYEAIGKILESLFIFIVGISALKILPSCKSLGFGYFLGSFISFLIFFLYFCFKFLKIKFVIDKNLWKEIFLLSWPLAFGGILTTIYANSDSVMIGFFKDYQDVGFYNAAQKIISICIIPLAILSQVFFPALSSSVKEGKSRFQSIFNYLFNSSTFLGIPILFGGLLLANRIIDFVYDPRYFSSIPALKILLFTCFLNYFSLPFSQSLLVLNYQKKIFFVILLTAILNIILNFLLIPKYSFVGASLTTLTSVILNAILMVYLFKKYCQLDFKLDSTFFTSLLAATVMVAILSQKIILSRHILLLVSLGGISYFLFFYLFYKFFQKIKIFSE